MYDNIESLFEFGSGTEEDCAYVAPFKHSASSSNWACKPLIKDNSIARERIDSEKGNTNHLIATPRDGLTLSVIAVSRRETFKNYCAEANVEINPDKIKCAQHTINVTHGQSRGTPITCALDVHHSPESMNSLSFDAVHIVPEMPQTTQVMNINGITP